MSSVIDNPASIKREEALSFEGRIVEPIYTWTKCSRITRGKKYKVEDVILVTYDDFTEDIFFMLKDDDGKDIGISYKCFRRLVS